MKEANLAMTEAIYSMLEALPEPALRAIRLGVDRAISDRESEREARENAIHVTPCNECFQNKIRLIKALRIATGMGIMEAKDLIENGGLVEIRHGKERDEFLRLLGG